MSVFIPIPIANLEQATEQPSRTYRLDRGRIFAAGSCDGIDAANQFIKKALLTPRFRCLIYDNQYGSEIKETIIADDVTAEYIETELPRIVSETLLTDSRILDVSDFSFSFSGEEAHVKVEAVTIFGSTVVEVVI